MSDPEQSKEATKFLRLKQELLETEQKYCSDLLMVHEVFLRRLAPAFGTRTVGKIFLNWEELIAISQKLIKHLSTVFAKLEPRLQAFVEFCGNQVSAMEELNRLENENLNFKQMYVCCCQDPSVRGLSLGYFLLLPMARVTRYPLLFEKMLKCTDKNDPQYDVLDGVYNMLKALCSEVNQAITEVENMNMLYWSQQSIVCDAITPKLVFPSSTRYRYPRVYLHSGILYKLRSKKMLVALLFNDFLLFTTPSTTISDPQSFKISKSTDLCLNMYKMPLMLETLSILPPKEEDDDGALILKSENNLIHLKAPNTNSRKMWENQLTKAIQQCREVVKQQTTSPKRQQRTQIGRLLLEIAEVINMDVSISSYRYGFAPESNLVELGSSRLKSEHSSLENVICSFQLEYPCTCEMNLSLSVPQKVSLGPNRTQGAPICTTQFDLYDQNERFTVGFFFPRQFTPDVCAGEFTIPIENLLNASVAHRGPILRQINMQKSDLAKPVGSVIMKFVVQMYS
uniref:DH domain-containing protein n=1 Tax=Steinernema glaseri TaxID=37863 RepID=A0A1I8AEC3_9BILA